MVSSRNLLIFPKHWSLLGRYRSIPFAVLPAFGLAQNPGLALVDLVSDLAQQRLHQARPTVIVGVDDKGEVPKELRPAYLMPAQVVCKVWCPAIVDQHTGVDRNDAERPDGFLAPLAMQVLEYHGTVGDCVQPLVFLADPEAGLIDMKGGACQKVFLGGDFPRFKRIVKPLDVAKTGGLGQLDARDGMYQFGIPAQRQHLSNQKVDYQCLNAIAILQRPRHVLRKTPLGSGAALGAVLDFRDDLQLFNRVFDIELDTLFTSRWFNV